MSCNKEEDEKEEVLDHSYSGVLSVEYTKGFPQYAAAAQLNVGIAKNWTFTYGYNLTIIPGL